MNNEKRVIVRIMAEPPESLLPVIRAHQRLCYKAIGPEALYS
ncbi:MAG: hypothetical protein ABJK59_03670 [Erythrobacter sp.]